MRVKSRFRADGDTQSQILDSSNQLCKDESLVNEDEISLADHGASVLQPSTHRGIGIVSLHCHDTQISTLNYNNQLFKDRS